MLYQYVYYLSLALFGILAVASFYGYLLHQTSESELVIDEPEKRLPGLIVDHEYIVRFRVHNRGSRMSRVVGTEFT